MMQCFCKKSKSYNCRIVLLDEQELIKEIQDNTKGQEILDAVFTHLNLLETAYFGLRYLDVSNQTHWLDANKGIYKQLKGSDPFTLYFGVKFYAADPCKLFEEITRYQFFLQVKQDILQGRLPVNFETAAELGAFAVQSEIGDYDPRRHSKGYVSEFRFTSNQTAELEARIEELHKELVKNVDYTGLELEGTAQTKTLIFNLPPSYSDVWWILPATAEESQDYHIKVLQRVPTVLPVKIHTTHRIAANVLNKCQNVYDDVFKDKNGLLPAAAEYNYLEKVKWLEMYGVDLHPVLGEDNVEYFLGLTPGGIIVLRYKNKVGHYFWPRISKIYFKGKYFMIKICDRKNEETTYGFETPSKPACKHLWKCCVEHHAFFRLLQVSPLATDIFSLGSRFRYSGRTEKQAQADVQMQLRKPPNFLRTPSRRYQRRCLDETDEILNVSCSNQKDNKSVTQMKAISVPQPINAIYRSANSIPAAIIPRDKLESPRSTRSAPWSLASNNRGLYSTSPKILVGHKGCHSSQNLQRVSHRSSSVDSQSSNDSRHCKRHKRHRSRRSSDNESELSKSSGRSHHRHHRQGSNGNNESDTVKNHKCRRKSRSSNGEGCKYNLVDSEPQWMEVKKRQAEGGTGVQQATVVNNISRASGYLNSGMETESEKSYHYKRKQHKKHRSRSRSPSEFMKGRLPDEVKKHLEYNLIDTEGMSETQLRDIPYKAVVVETNSDTNTQRKQPPNGKMKHHTKSIKRSSKPKKSTEISGENFNFQYLSYQNLPDSITPTAKRKPFIQISSKDLNYLKNIDKV